jgi:hypothetical protein
VFWWRHLYAAVAKTLTAEDAEKEREEPVPKEPASAIGPAESVPIALPAVAVPSVAVPPATERVATEAPATADSASTADAADAAAAEALASLVIPDEERHCQGCGTTVGKLLRCGGCQRVFFCSRTCQGLAWPRHKDLCAEIKAAKMASASDSPAPSPQHAWLCALLVQHAKARAAEVAFRMGSVSSYRRSAELSREAARVASLRAALAAHEPARRVCCMHEAQMHGMSANAWLRCGDVPAALRAARLASTCAEASGDVAQCVEAKIALGTAFMKLPDETESHRDTNGLATEPVAEAIAIFREAVALCEREWAASAAGTPPVAFAPMPGPPMETPAGRLRDRDRDRDRRLQAAEASARSNLARALHGSDPARALVELERAVALRRRVLADAGAEANTEADDVPEKRRQLASTLCNYAAILSAADQLGAARSAFEEALPHARSGGDPGLERVILTNLVSMASSDGAPVLGPASRGKPPAADARSPADAPLPPPAPTYQSAAYLERLREVIESTGRSADTICCCCLEPLDDPQTVVALGCSHLLHRQCAIEWSQRSAVCPQCKAPMIQR